MDSIEFIKLIKDIKENDKEYKISPRKLLSFFHFEKRTTINRLKINKYLEQNQIEVEPDYANTWIDGVIFIRHKKRAKSKKESDPIQRLELLTAANREPICISRDAKLSEAVTLMMMHNFSQLPVLNGPRNVVGIITWETIGWGLANKCVSDDAKGYISKSYTILDNDTPLLDAIPTIIEKEFVLVQKHDKTLCGIVTTADISSQFLILTEPFLILEQIENIIRQILDGKYLLEELKGFVCENNSNRSIEHIDDLTFGEYIRIIEKPENWGKLNLSIDRTIFINQLNKIKDIRNDIMHFEPEGITSEQLSDLRKMSKFLMQLRSNSKCN
ncbi:MAG: XRE family transcriptional regulator [Ignavibacteria bacterium GWB2_35_12]|nr:MAG: XRE family transcriptional regulator [Ignavibacteria bacterium GWB2_35_12]OGU91526.1 MAG: XRE family transcriptional regulator [Ignavibacteria bacterium RIFOXYA2_FULL_35_10]OGV24808.1 MAG: XRE family transcriptional regulator [Ignavibacteria bacterium RIFOXYC2_FULL_35_21]